EKLLKEAREVFSQLCVDSLSGDVITATDSMILLERLGYWQRKTHHSEQELRLADTIVQGLCGADSASGPDSVSLTTLEAFLTIVALSRCRDLPEVALILKRYGDVSPALLRAAKLVARHLSANRLSSARPTTSPVKATSNTFRPSIDKRSRALAERDRQNTRH
ncbi:hypothetical protein KIPB_015268, partial [Kipferlia bialata]